MKKQVDALLNKLAAQAKPKPGQKCRCCNTPIVHALILRYFQRLDAGEDMPSFSHLCLSIIQPQFGICQGSVRGHVLRCLKRTIQPQHGQEN